MNMQELRNQANNQLLSLQRERAQLRHSLKKTERLYKIAMKMFNATKPPEPPEPLEPKEDGGYIRY